MTEKPLSEKIVLAHNGEGFESIILVKDVRKAVQNVQEGYYNEDVIFKTIEGKEYAFIPLDKALKRLKKHFGTLAEENNQSHPSQRDGSKTDDKIILDFSSSGSDTQNQNTEKENGME